jgi:intracellular multiplication protein IcmO
MRRLPNVEQRHEIKTGQQIIDPRSMFAKFAEWLGLYHNLVIAVFPAVILTAVAPVMAFVTLPYVLIVTVAHVTMKSILPVRYPMGFTDDKGKPGTGIMYVGAVDSVSEYEEFKEIWLSDDDMRKHMLILGSTGSGKSEALKALFYNALNWSSGFFIADGKADNRLPTDVYTMCRSVGRDQDLLILNFLLAGKTPEQVRRSRRRRTNMLNPFPSADADTIIQMGANLLPKVEGDAKNWQEKALNLWRSVVQALAYKRDTQGFDLSISVFIDYMSLTKVEELYLEGYFESQTRDGEWSYGFAGIKNYLESGVPGYMIAKLLKKNGIGVEEPSSSPQMKRPGQAGKEFEQDSMAYEQHSYRTNQLMPVLNLLDKTYGFIFRAKYPEIDMSDVTLRNRILVMLIPSLEKSASEAENLGKLSIACLRVMMSKNLGAEVEGDHEELLGSKATNSPYPYLVALDELAYYFSDGIAVMFAQARSLGMAMVAAAQDLEKLTEGSRAAEAGAMIANTFTKFFMRIDDTGKTAEMIQRVVGKATVALKRSFKFNGYGYNRKADVEVTEVDRVSTQRLQSFGAGEGVINAMGRTTFMKWFYMAKDIEEHQVKAYYVNRFLQVAPPSNDEVIANSIAIDQFNDPYRKGRELVALLRQERVLQMDVPHSQELTALSAYAASLSPHLPAEERAILLYMRLRELLAGQSAQEVASAGGQRTSRSSGGDQSHKQAPRVHGHDGFTGEVKPEDESGTDEDVLAEHPLSFLLSTPFARKPAAEVLDGLEEQILGAQSATDMSALYLDPVQAMISSGRTMSLDASAALKGKALALLVGAPTALSDPVTGLPIETKDDWIGAALHRACEMVATPRSSDHTVVGFSPETMERVVAVEQIMRSPSPQLAGKSFERVVAEKVTPSTVPDNIGVDVSMDEMDAFFAKLKGQKS